jgi:L-asparaginase II
MGNPVLVDVTRGARSESRHRGAVAVVDADGATVLAIGDVAMPVYPRSAVKAIQALPLIESGAAARFGLGTQDLALACASHGGEPAHVAGVRQMLARAGLDQAALLCGVHWPMHQASARALARAGGEASALHNNCSGKHAGFLCAACAMGADLRDYIGPDHPVQREIKAVLEQLGGAAIPEERRATDGCSIPTWAMPLDHLARAFARFGTGHGLGAQRAAAAGRLRAACAEKPWFVAGTGRFCTDVMARFGARVFVKTGAEGVYCAALPERGFGIAIKCDDGGTRAAEVVIAATIARLQPMSGDDRAFVDGFVRPELRNWCGVVVGGLAPAPALIADIQGERA